jgi:mRNA degradation ribonuclease J1/J2
VDNFGNDAAVFFLSHAHTDHMTGLAHGWARGPLYTTEQTRLLLLQRFRIDPNLVHVLTPYEETHLTVGIGREQLKGMQHAHNVRHH